VLPPGREWMAKLALLHNKGCHRCGVGQGAARELAHKCIETDVVLSHRAAVAEVRDAGQEAGHVELLWATWTKIVVGWQRVRGRHWILVVHVHWGGMTSRLDQHQRQVLDTPAARWKHVVQHSDRHFWFCARCKLDDMATNVWSGTSEREDVHDGCSGSSQEPHAVASVTLVSWAVRRAAV